ncbi:DUF192 domain-containing protein [Aurantiacibacter sp. D1-12]|uniref:DUF192 domain-containing protein n=1 Tax=Aurantiacibacter sp. D1-12 TaxID=2993658 RepID=UPI00237CBF91|nr:DUF192 domain-containing protein [Aurantiacibacter sp. D1-12]MDE1467561.1 DUF192 domain-containing protein [Aurantiacibacter sp. D1-12]
MNFGRNVFAALAALTLAACSGEAAQEAAAPVVEEAVATHPISGLEVIPVTLTTSNGTHVIQAEVAATQQEQSRGLMFRQELGPDEGMIFPKDPVQPLSFWMRNTVIPLDLIFIDENRQVINIGQGEPYNEEPITSDRPGIAVLELAAGRSEELGLEPGDSVEW